MLTLASCTTLVFLPVLAGQGAAPSSGSSNPYQSSQPGQVPYYGPAALIDASGRLMLATQEASLMREQVRSAQLENRRKRLEQWMWERDNLPKPEDERQRLLQEQLRRSRQNPPLTEIWSARALNDLLIDLEAVENLADPTPINQELLEKIDLTTGKGSGSAGLLKGDLKWRPQLLRRKEFASQVDALMANVLKAANQVIKGQLDAALIDELRQGHRKVRARLTQVARAAAGDDEFTPALYIDASTYLEQLNDVIKLLQKPDAARYFDAKFVPKGKSVKELVTFMKENGLQFAPATPGAEDAYTAVHGALAAASRRSGAQEKK